MQLCCHCRYFVVEEEDDDGPDLGTCHRYAPRPLMYLPIPGNDRGPDLDYRQFPVWPQVMSTEGCGEWSPFDLDRTKT